MNKFLLAQVIRNPALEGTLGSGGHRTSSTNFADLIGTFIRVMVIIASLGFILYFIIGAVEWITGGGDKGKVEEAKNHIINALTGLTVMLAFYAVAVFLREVLHIDLLNIIWPTPTTPPAATP